MNKSTGLFSSEIPSGILFDTLLKSSPVPTCIFTGPEHIIALANEAFLRAWGKNNIIIGQSVYAAVPEFAEQGVEEILKSVITGGLQKEHKQIGFHRKVEGKPYLFYYQFTF